MRPGETVVDALTRVHGLPILQRSIRYHRPRAPFCGIGLCTQCLVTVDGRPNVRACRYEPTPGDAIATENAWPSPNFDLLGILDFVFARGIDTLHGFRRPGWATPLYHRIVRRLAGYAKVPEATPSEPVPRGEVRVTDYLVIGSGVAGRAAAERLREANGTSLLIDEGQIGAPAAEATALADTTAVFLPPPVPSRERPFRLVGRRARGVGLIVQASKVIVANGGYDASLLFAGNDRPGVMTADGALRLLEKGADRLRTPLVLLGGGIRAASVLGRLGGRVSAVVAPGEIQPELVRQATDLSIPLYPRTLVVAAHGRRRLSSIALRPRGRGNPFTLPCQTIVLAHRRLPHSQLLFQSGCRMEWHADPGAYFPRLSEGFGTSVPGLFAAGEAAGYFDPEAAIASGRSAAEGALGLSPSAHSPVPQSAGRPSPNELESYFREWLRLRGGRSKSIACACEDVLVEELLAASSRGYRGIEVIKRYTGIGTGLCQGRYCLPDALLLLSILENRPPAEVGYITQRPPVVPAPLEVFAGLPASELP